MEQIFYDAQVGIVRHIPDGPTVVARIRLRETRSSRTSQPSGNCFQLEQ
jgi:hypothetical protein